MPTPTQPNLGYGKQSEATIDQVNQWMRGTDWYQNKMREWGEDPGHPGKLSRYQSDTIRDLAQANGVVVDQGHMEVDDHGNFNPIGHKGRNTLIVIGLAAATIATMGAAGAFSGAALGPTTAATMGETSAIVGGGAVPASLAALTPAEIAAAGAAGGAAASAPVLEGIAAGGGGASTAVPAGAAAAGGGGAAGGGLSSAELAAMSGELPAGAAAGGGAAAAGGSVFPAATYAADGTVSTFASAPAMAGGGLGTSWLNTPMGLGLLGSGINAATSIYGTNKQASAAEQAALLNSQSAKDQLAFLQQKDAADRAAQEARDAEAKREWDTTTGLNLAQWNRRQAQLEPYRQKSLAAGQELSRRLGLPAPTGGWNVPNPPVTLADASMYGGGGGGGAAVAPTPTDPTLTDPSKWMALVGNDAQLTDFVTKGLGNAASVPGLVDYYKTKVKGQPGANAMEQKGSAAYWNEKFASDPHRTGGSTSLSAAAPTPTAPRPFQPSASSLAAFTPTVITPQPTSLADYYGQYAVQEPDMAYTDAFAQQVQQLYGKYGRTASDQEIDSHRGNPGGLDAIDALLKRDTPSLSPSDPNFNPNVNTPTTWDPNTNAPKDTFAGWQWDPKMARYMNTPAPPTADPSTGGGDGGGGGGGGGQDYGNTSAATSASSQMGGPGMLDPWLQQFTPREQTKATLAPPPTATPAPTLSGPASGAYSQAGFTAPGDGNFSYGDYQAPDKFSYGAYQTPDKFSYGDYQAPDKFSYDAFNAPDKFVAPDDVTMQNDPGYQFRKKTGQQEFLNSAAAKGLTRSGGTMKDFINYNQEAASQEYENVYGRAKGEWDTDYQAKQGTYNTNRANAADIWDKNANLGLTAYQTNRSNAADIYNTNANQGLVGYQTNRANAADIYNTNANMGLTAYNTNRGNAFQNYTTNFGNALQGWQANAANNANVYNTNWGAQKDVYNSQMAGWQGINAMNTDIWKTQNANALAQNQVSWNQDWQQYLQQYDAFKRNQEWPYQVLNQQSQPVG